MSLSKTWVHQSFIGAALTFAVVLSAPQTSEACGGFFCSQVPIDQAGEQILFAVEGTTVTAHIQIQYQGAAEKFSWVLPLPSMPEVRVGTDLLFSALNAQTRPRFEIDWLENTDCANSNMPCPEAAFDDGATAGGGNQNGTVQVLEEGEVGPYEYSIVESDDGDALYAWLNANEYDQPEESKPIVQFYTNQSYKFVAIRLQKGKAVGEIQPLVVKFDSPTLACVPLKLTSIAATEDMPVYSWILAKARAVPMNFFHVVLNAKAYPWLECANGNSWSWGGGQSPDCIEAYQNLVSKAADAANGHAFVTEFAGDAAIMDEQIYVEGMYDLEKLKTITSPEAYLQELLNQGFPRTGLMQAVIQTAIPKPNEETLPEDCKSDQEFYTWNMEECLKAMPADWSFDPIAMTADLEERVVEPMKQAQALFGTHTYLTRFFTTLSPDEMTKDPTFSFNPDLPPVSNVHTIQAQVQCATPGGEVDAVKLIYGPGDEVTVAGQYNECGGFGMEDGADPTAGQPAEAAIQVMNESGEAETINPDKLDEAEAQLDVRVPNPQQSNVTAPPDDRTNDPNSGTFGTPQPGTNTGSSASGSSGSGGSGCTQSAQPFSGGGAAFALMLLLATLGLRRLRTDG